MPLDALYLEVLFACGYSLIQPRLSTDDYFPRFRWSCLSGPSGPIEKPPHFIGKHLTQVVLHLALRIHLEKLHLVMTVEVWIWGFSLLFPQALIPANSG